MEFNLTHHQWPALGKDESNSNQLLQTHNMFAQNVRKNEAVQFPYPVLDLGIEFGFDPEACEPFTTAAMEVPSILTTCKEEEEDNEQWTDVKTFRKNCKGGLRPRRYMIDTLEGIRCSIKCGGCVFHGHTESKFKLLGGHKKHRNLHKGKKYWFHIVNKGKVKHLTSDGPYGQACVILDMKNNKTNRKRLQTFYIRNNLDLNTAQTHDENTSPTQDRNFSQTHNKNSKQQKTSKTKQQNTSHSKQQNTSHSNQQNTSHFKQQNTSHSKQQNTSNTKKQNTSQTQDLNISQTNDMNSSHTKKQNASQTKEQYSSQTQYQNTSQTQDLNNPHIKDQDTSQAQEPNTSQTRKQTISLTKKKNKSQAQDLNTSHSKEQLTSQTQNQNKSQAQDLNTSQTKEQLTSQKKEQNTSQTQNQNTSQTQNLDTSHSKEQNTSQKKKQNLSLTKKKKKSQAQDLNTAHTKEQNASQTKKQNVSLTKKKNKSQTQEQNTSYTLKQHCAQVNTQKGSQSQAHKKNTSQEQQSSMTLKQNVSHKLHTKQSQSQSVTPLHHQSTNQSQSQQTTHLQHQNITQTQQNKTNTFQQNDMQHVNTDDKEQINHEKNQLCVCNSTSWQDFGPMIQCEACNQWYHFKCILRRKRRISDSFFEQESKFICGYKNCKFSSSILVVGGRYIPLIKKCDIANCVSNYNSDLLADSKNLSLEKINDESEVKDSETVESLCFPVTSVGSPLCSDSEDSSAPVGICDSPVFPRKVRKTISDSTFQCENIPSSPVFPRKVRKTFSDSTFQCENIPSSPVFPRKVRKTFSDSTFQCENNPDSALQCDNIPSVPLSTEAISEILGVNVPNDFFVYEKLKSRSFTFDFDPEIFHKLKSNQIKRCFAVNSWQNYFIEGIRKSNKFCVFAFKNHSVSNAKIRSRKINSPIFKAIGICKFCDCTSKVYLRMYSETLVHVHYTGNIKHNIHEHHSRPLIGDERENIKKLMKTGEKPLNLYLEKLGKIPATELVAGNIGNIGMNTKKIFQAGVESRQAGRSDPDLIASLLIQKDSNGFIQKVCAHPMYLLYWSDFGLKLYNEKANSNILYWNATGTVVRKSDTNKQFLYYEMSIAHPIEGKMGIPCCAMLSCDQSVTTILDWLRSFRHAEKLKFGYNKAIKFPKIIISDQSMVFIIAALKEFNNEDLPDFLLRAYIIGKGEASVKDTQKTVVHLCKSHFLNSVKRFLRKKEVSISKVKACLFMIGILMKCNNLCDLKELLFDIILAVSCRQITNEIKPYLQRLISKINSFKVSAYTESDFDPDLFVDDDDYNANRYSEEDYQILGSKSPFKTLTLKIQEKTVPLIVEMCDIKLPANNLYCPIFLDHLIKSVMPLYPLWSSLLLGNLQRFNQIYPSSSANFPSNTTNSLIENRFRILKYLTLKGHKQFRIDEFSEALRFHTMNIQKKSALDCLKTKHKCFTRKRKSDKDSNLKDEGPPQKKNRTLIKENWNKKREQPVHLKNKKIGTYQKPPKRKLVLDKDTVTQPLSDDQYTVLPNTDHNYIVHVPQTGENKIKQVSLSCYMAEPSLQDINRLRNFGVTCWFNSVVQAYYFSRLADTVMKKNQIISIGDSDSEFIDTACKSIIDIWLFMKNNKGKFVPNSLLRNSLVKTCLAVPTFSQDQQQDASEFISHIISEMSHSLINNLEILLTQECLGCQTIKQRVNNEGHLLLLHIERSLANLSVQTLIDNFFSIKDEVKLHCTSCKLLTSHKISKFVQSFPDTLALVLGRYFQDSSGTLRKIHTPVIISSKLNFSDLGYDNMCYQFKSAICHKGGSTRTGHYVTIIKSNNKYICCDDSNISEVKNCTLSDIAYVLLFNKIAQPLPKQLKKFIVCLFSTDILKKILKDDMVKYINTEKVQLIESMVTSGLSLDLERVIENDFGLQKNSNMKEGELNSLKNVYSLFIDYLLGSDSDNCLHMRNKLFMVNSIEICQCNKCEVSKKNFLTSSIITLKNVEFSDKNMFSRSLKEQSKFQIADLMCNCGKSPYHTTLFLSLPNVLIFNIEDPKSMVLPQTVCLSNTLTCYPLDSMNFNLKAILCFTGRECKAILKFEGQYVDAETKEQFSLKSLKQQDIVYLFYSKSLSVESISNLNESSCCFHEMPEIECVKSFLAKKNICVKQVSGVRITKDFHFSLIDSNSWLNNDHINVYLECLAINSLKKVHNVECGWFIQNLFNRAKLDQVKWFTDCLESKKEWFQFEYIVIPVNENNMHWTVLVVDIISKKIYYCNSNGSNGNYQYVAFQIWRYLSFEAIMHSNIILRDSEWKLVDYSKQNNFPFQTDSSSCGVYVCAVAKSIIFNRSLPNASNLRLFRLQMATEISNM